MEEDLYQASTPILLEDCLDLDDRVLCLWLIFFSVLPHDFLVRMVREKLLGLPLC